MNVIGELRYAKRMLSNAREELMHMRARRAYCSTKYLAPELLYQAQDLQKEIRELEKEIRELEAIERQGP